MLDAMPATLEAGREGVPQQVQSTVTVLPALPEDWDPYAATLT